MSYQVLSTQEEPEEPPRYNGNSSHAGGINIATSSKSNRPAYSQSVNYVHNSDVGDIIGTVYNIDTDKPPAYGRFDNQEEQDQAPNVYLSAKTIVAEIRLSGSKKAKIEIQGCTNNSYGRTMIRIVDDAKPLPDGAPGPPTHFSINVSATCKSSSIIAVPSSFSGSITGACSLTGSIRDEAICLVADAKKSRWTVRQDHDNYASGSTSAGSQQQYPPSTTSPEDLLSKADTTTQQATALEEAPNVPEHSSVTYTLLESPGLGDKSGKLQRAQRHVIYDNDYKIGLKVLDSIEDKFRKSIRKFLLIYLLSCLAWLIFIYSIVKYFDGPPEAFFALTLMPLACSVVVPMVAIPDAWPMYFYKPPVVGTV